MMTQERLKQERLKEVLDYDPDTGLFTWRVKTCHKVVVGKVAGCLSKTPHAGTFGYIVIRIDRVLYLAHRLVWLYVTGSFPDGNLDHINGNRSDNRISNLRPCTNSENQQNRSAQKNNTSGRTGVRGHGVGWVASIMVQRKQIHLGLFPSFEEAVFAREEAERKYHPFNTGRTAREK